MSESGDGLVERQKLPEFAPLREYNKDCPICVVVYDQNDNIIREEKMNYAKHEDRVWLGKISFWSWQNDYYVETYKDK